MRDSTDEGCPTVTSTIDLHVLWAKSNPRHPLWKHLLDASSVSLALPNVLSEFHWSAEQLALIVGLHDVGKADPVFQHQVPEFCVELKANGFHETADARCRHERISSEFIRQICSKAGMDCRTKNAVVRAVAAHHGRWEERARPVPPVYETAQHHLFDMLREGLGIPTIPIERPRNLSAFGMRLSGHIVLSDWIASNEAFFTDPRLNDIDQVDAYLQKAGEVARDWVRRLSLESPQYSGKPMAVVQNPRPLQAMLLKEEILPGLTIIEAPMGEGKTEAAWILAEKWRDRGFRGTYMALPTMATSDSIHGRYRDDYLKKLGHDEDAKLVHGMAWLRDLREPDTPMNVGEVTEDRVVAATWFRPTRRAMLASHGIGTVDQAMLAAMHVKFGFLRMYGLAGRVLVIDEVHAYDAYMLAILTRLLEWCASLGTPVVLLSATLSNGQRTAMLESYGATDCNLGPKAPYPLVSNACPGHPTNTFTTEATIRRQVTFQKYEGFLGDANRSAELARTLVAEGGCCCIVVNTVKQAQSVYRSLLLPSDEKCLFHARFSAEHREEIARNVMAMFGKDTSQRPTRFVLVATQVVEQSLDVDFDHMVTELAPIDLLLQRSGRLHRHRQRREEPTLHVLLPENGCFTFDGTGYVYAEKPLLRTLAILDAHPAARLPMDFRILIEQCYGDEEWDQSAVDWGVIRAADVTWTSDVALLRRQGSAYTLKKPNLRAFDPVNNDPVGDENDDGSGWRAATRLGANDRTSVVLPLDEALQLASGMLPMCEVRDLYRSALKLPSYLPLQQPDTGYHAAIEAQGKLQGLLLLPVDDDGIWHGRDNRGNRYEVVYDKTLGLLAGRIT